MQPALRIAPMTAARARETAGWCYEGDLAVYDHPAWEAMVAQRWGLADAGVRERQFVAILGLDGRVAGFLRFMPREDRVAVGLGLRPDLCGQGLGAQAMALLRTEAERRHGECLLELEVRSFNARAIRCYERAGWRRVVTYEGTTRLGPGEFVVMQRRIAD